MLCARVIRGMKSSAKLIDPLVRGLPDAFGTDERVRHPDDHLTGVKPVDVVAAVLRVHPAGSHLHDDGRAEHVRARPDARTVCRVGLVGEACPLACAVLHDDVHACVGQPVHHRRHQSHPSFPRERFRGYPDDEPFHVQACTLPGISLQSYGLVKLTSICM